MKEEGIDQNEESNNIFCATNNNHQSINADDCNGTASSSSSCLNSQINNTSPSTIKNINKNPMQPISQPSTCTTTKNPTNTVPIDDILPQQQSNITKNKENIDPNNSRDISATTTTKPHSSKNKSKHPFAGRPLPLSSSQSNTHENKSKSDSQTIRKRKRKCNQTCKFDGCTNHDGMTHIKFKHVPKPALEKSVPKPTNRKEKFISYHSKDTQHQAFLDAMSLDSTLYSYHNTRICDAHKIMKFEKSMNICQMVGGEMKKQGIKFTYEAPESHGIHSTLTKNKQTLRRKHTARERRVLREWDDCYENQKNTAGKEFADDYKSLSQSYQQMAEVQTPTKNLSRTQRQSNEGSYDPFLSPLGIKLYQKSNQRGFKRESLKNEKHQTTFSSPYQPTIFPCQLSKREVKRRTGFKCKTALLKYVCIVCNANFKTMMNTQSSLTWFEEWFLLFEMLWGKTHTRVEDLVGIYQIANCSTFYSIIDQKLDLLLACRMSWPTYASHEEDSLLRKKKWNEKYKDARIVMWDDTNIPFTYQPSGAQNQKITYSSYYAMNCAKGGVFLQLCGWMGVEELWVGATSDSFYIEKSGILRRQREFAEKDKVGDKYVPFIIILDKGYRIIRIAWREGKQVCLQPKFAKSDAQFTSNDLNFSGSVAADRSGNERAVRCSKMSSMLARGLKPNRNPAQMNKVWESWSFQTNFMFGPVL